MTRDGRRSKRTREAEEASLAIRRILAERLSTLATAEVASRILDTAVRQAALSLVPADAGDLAAFTHGSLRAVTEAALGEDSADALVDDLVPLLRAMSATFSNTEDSQIRLTVRPEVLAGTVRPRQSNSIHTPIAPARLEAFDEAELVDQGERGPPPLTSAEVLRSEPPDQPHVEESAEFEALSLTRESYTRLVFASASTERADAIAEGLGARVSLTRVDDVFDLVDHASAHSVESVYVILDGSHSTVRPTTLAAATSELPAGTVVVLWDTPTMESDELSAIAPEAEAWTKLPGGTTTGDLLRYLRSVLPEVG